MRLEDLDFTEEFASKLLRGANLPLAIVPQSQEERLQNAPRSQQHYEKLVDTLGTIRKYKVLSYGESRYDVTSARFDLSMAFSDIHRKYIRLREQIFGDKQLMTSTESLADSAADLANYAIMMLEIICTIEAMAESKKEQGK